MVKNRKKEILTPKEKKYLSNVIEPFRDRVRYILKNDYYGKKEYICIYLNGDSVSLPCFKENTMYQGMEPYKEYTLEELDL